MRSPIRIGHLPPALMLLLALPAPRLQAQAQAPAVQQAFVQNRGQWPAHLRYGSRQQGITSWFTEEGVHLLLEQLPKGWDHALIRHKSRAAVDKPLASRESKEPLEGHALFLRPFGRSANCRLQATGATLGVRHELRTRTVIDIPRREGLRYIGVWPGVDLRFGHGSGLLEYEMDIDPGVDLQDLVFALEGAGRMSLGEQGELRAETSLGMLVQSRPRAFIGSDQQGEVELVARFVLVGDGRFGFEVDGWDGRRLLRIDPGIQWAGYVGGTAEDGFNGVCSRKTGEAIAVGFSYSWNYPTTVGAYQQKWLGYSDVVVVKWTDAAKKLVWATYIGGSAHESAFMVDCDSGGRILLGGWTNSPGFPTAGKPLQPTYGGGISDAFVTMLDGSGSRLVFSTFLGGRSEDGLYGLQVDAKGDVYTCGETNSSNFPVTPGSFGRPLAGKMDAFVCRTNATGSVLRFGGLVGGKALDGAIALSVDTARGRCYVCGTTRSPAFPVTPLAYDRSYNGGPRSGDVFVLALPLAGNSILAATYLGALGDETPWAIDLDPSGNPVLVGDTLSALFPTTTGVLMPTARGGGDAWVTRMNRSLNSVTMSTFFGGGKLDMGLGLDVEADGKIRISGSTFSNGGLTSLPFPTTAGAYSNKHSGGEDAFVLRMDAQGRRALYSSLYGGSGNEWFFTDARNGGGWSMPVAGLTTSKDFPVAKTSAPFGGKEDGLLALLDLLPAGASLGGTSSPACSGVPTMIPAIWPKAGYPGFDLLASKAPPRQPGLLLIGTAASKPILFAGVDIWLDLYKHSIMLPVMANVQGQAAIRLALPPMKGAVASLQLFWIESPKCARPLSSTQYLRLQLQ